MNRGAGRGVAWWRLRAFARAPAGRYAAAVWATWLGLTAAAVALAVLEARWNWSGMPLSVGGLTLGFSLYPPLPIAAFVALWLGPAFGAATAYVSTLASGLTGGLDPVRAALFALGTPAEVLLLWFLMLMLRVRPHLPQLRDWWRFCAAALIAAAASSLDIMLYNEAHRLPLETAQRLWQGWIFGDTAQLCLVVAPALRWWWPRAHDFAVARLGAPQRELSAINTVLLMGFVWVTLAGLALLGLRLMATAFDVPANANTTGGDLLLPRLREMFTFLVVLVGVLLVSTMALTAELVASRERNLALSMRDDLTGVFNRRAFRRLFEREEERSRTFDRAVSLIYFDLDYFKAINDQHGHGVGDRVLIAVAREAQSGLRTQDLLFRWGGDEFVILLPYTNHDEAQALARALHAKVEEKVSTPGMPVTISVGVASMRAGSDGRDDLVEAADTAVRRAKQLGRNRVVADDAVVS